MFSYHNRTKLKIKKKVLPGKFLNIWKLKNTFLKITVETEEITREIKNILT